MVSGVRIDSPIRQSTDASRSARWLKVLGTLNEFQARLFVADKALEMGRGGMSQLAQITGMSRPTITKGVKELQGHTPPAFRKTGKIRKAGGGRKRVEEVDPEIRRRLTRIVEETTAGDPMSLLKWTSKSSRTIAEELTRMGGSISWVTVARCLHEMGYSLQANVKTKEGAQHPDRDAQFRYINAEVKKFLRTGDPVISVDTKKKELVGAFRNAGCVWRPTGNPKKVLAYDFPQLAEGKAIPYGAYDVAQDRAVVHVGVTHDTAEFAVESIRRWWRWDGKKTYSAAGRLLICADGGGSNGSRLRAWKVNLPRLANHIGVPITVCHYPPGTSKWNKIEHRLFSFISLNWKGQPLVSYEAIINLIGSTRTRTGLRVKALLDTKEYETGVPVSPQQIKELNLRRHSIPPDWNYTISPQTT
ncbi:MAG: ISAzo13 family transposase [Terriglobia bacterium]